MIKDINSDRPTPETLSPNNETRLAVRLNESEEIFPIFVSNDADDNFSQFIQAEVARLKSIQYTIEFTEDDEQRLLTLTGVLLTPIHITTKEGQITSYNVSSFQKRSDLEWFQFLDKHPDTAKLCETKKPLYDTVRNFFKIRLDYATDYTQGLDVNYQDYLKIFNAKVDEFIEKGQLSEDDLGNLKPYFEEINELLRVS